MTCSKGAKVQSVRITELTGQISAKTDKHAEFSSTGTDAWSPLPLMTAPIKPVLSQCYSFCIYNYARLGPSDINLF